MKAIQNRSRWDTRPPTVRITEAEEGWPEAYGRWLRGEDPTDNPLWKEGVFWTCL